MVCCVAMCHCCSCCAFCCVVLCRVELNCRIEMCLLVGVCVDVFVVRVGVVVVCV